MVASSATATLSEQAQRNLDAAGIDNVTLVVGDGARGLPETAPFDAINVAAAAGDDIPPALVDQLGPGGAARRAGRDRRPAALARAPHPARALERKGLERVRFVPLVTT